jgi:hypothetical protein
MAIWQHIRSGDWLTAGRLRGYAGVPLGLAAQLILFVMIVDRARADIRAQCRAAQFAPA